MFGHGTEHDDNPSDLDARPPTQRHILITGAFGSLGKHIVRDLLLGLSAKEGAAPAPPVAGEEWMSHGAAAAAIAGHEDVLVTMLDVADRTEELDFLLQNAPGALVGGPVGTDPRAAAFASSERSVGALVKNGKLRVLRGDVRDRGLMERLLTDKGTMIRRPSTKGHQEQHVVIPPVSGVIHLASYPPAKCAVNPTDCADVEKSGMESILAGLERKGIDRKATKEGREAVVADRPWVVMPRRGDVWHSVANSDKLGPSAASVGPAQVVLKTFTSRHPLHSLLLQLPSSDSIIGDPFAPRFDPAPHVIQSALGNLPIQVSTSSAMLDPFLAIRDATRSIIQGARMLELASRKDYIRLLGFVAELEVVGPKAPGASRDGPVADLARTAVSMISSHSALSDKVSLGAAELAAGAAGVRKRDAARRVSAKALGAAPAIPVIEAAKTYMDYLLIRQAAHLATKVNVACASPPSLGVLEEGMMALGGCNAQLLTLIDGSYYTLGCSAGIDGAPGPLALLPAVPFEEGIRGVDLVVERGLEGKVDVQLKCPVLDSSSAHTGKLQTVAWTDTKSGGQFANAGAKGADVIAEWFSVDFVERDTRAFTLTLPPTEGLPREDDPARRLTLHLPAQPDGELKFRIPANEAPALLFKVNPICCAAAPASSRKNAWDFFKEDPLITSQVTFATAEGKATLESSTLALQRCLGLRAEHERLLAVQAALKRSTAAAFCEPLRGEAASWKAGEYATCSSDCEAPLACLASDKCRCTRDRCGNTGRLSPFPEVVYSDRLSFSAEDGAGGGEPLRKRKWHGRRKRAPVKAEAEAEAERTLAERVERLPWDGLILPGARAAFNLKLDELPSVHVVGLPASIDDHLTTPSCWKLDKAPLPLMGDHYLIEALRNVSVQIEDSDFALVPFYQGCYFNYEDHNTFRKLAETWEYAEGRLAGADQIVGSRIAVPFTHDYGSCTGWWPRLEDALGKEPPSPMDQAVAWQVNGDYNTRCVKPDQDVITPAITKNTKQLISRYGDLANVKPTKDRDHLAFFSGTVRGFGAFARTRIGCGRKTSLDLLGLGSGATGRILYQELAESADYLGTLNNAKFCLLPRGIPAWTTRTFDAVFAGCIPVFLVDRNLFPHQDVFDYAQFSLTIPENEAHRVEQVLEQVGEEEAARMQVALLKVRESFIFREEGGGVWERGARGEGKGPAWMGRVAMALRLGLGYPSAGSCLSYHGEA